MADKKKFDVEDILAEERSKRRQARQQQEDSAPAAAPAQESDAPRESRQASPASAPAPRSDERDTGKKKKKRRGLFGRKKKDRDFDESEDMYYGVQLKPIDEYRKGYDPVTGEFTLGTEEYSSLFDDSKKAIDDEVEENFQRLQRERRRRVAEAVQTAGVDEDQLADELGVVAPMPVTAFSADPYAKQHGIEVEGSGGEVADFQKAMIETSGDSSMEVKLNVGTDTMEIQRVKEVPAVSEETVTKILESVQAEKKAREEAEAAEQEPAEETALPDPEPETQPEESAQKAPAGEETQGDKPQPVISASRPLGEIPHVASYTEYRPRSIPTHVIKAEVLQSALLSEAEDLRRDTQEGEEEELPARRKGRSTPRRQEEEEVSFSDEGRESIDDYTGPEDAKSISNELRGDMRELTMRMTITGVCTALLTLVNIIFGRSFASGGEPGGAAVAYVVMTVIFLMVSVGVCYRTVLNGLKTLLAFKANSDSGVAVASAAVLVQTIASIFFRNDLVDGKLHLYAVVLSAFLFVNAAGKLTMIRRIHSNFRFVSSKENKYAVRVFDDYNTALKMLKDRAVQRPLIAYQCRAGFLKRFLEISYQPDPAESASQALAPVGLIATLVLGIVSLLVSRNVPTTLSVLAAGACACVAVGNMLSINLPISRLCRAARRAGGMVSGYEAVEQLGNVNSILLDADDVFPRGTVVLNGIKTFGDRAGAEEGILLASALMREVGGPLAGVFEQVISENEESLGEVESWSYEDGGGIVATVDGKQICLGRRGLLINHRVEVPARDEETRYAPGNKTVVYISVEDKVAAMLVLSYSADRRRKNELQRLEQNGCGLVIRTTDPNVEPQMVSRLFGISADSVCVLEGSMGETGDGLLGARIGRADAIAATKGRVESLLSLVSACIRERRGVGALVAIQNAGVILGFILVAFMACFGGMRQLSSFVLFVFELFWLLVVLVLPKLRR